MNISTNQRMGLSEFIDYTKKHSVKEIQNQFSVNSIPDVPAELRCKLPNDYQQLLQKIGIQRVKDLIILYVEYKKSLGQDDSLNLQKLSQCFSISAETTAFFNIVRKLYAALQNTDKIREKVKDVDISEMSARLQETENKLENVRNDLVKINQAKNLLQEALNSHPNMSSTIHSAINTVDKVLNNINGLLQEYYSLRVQVICYELKACRKKATTDLSDFDKIGAELLIFEEENNQEKVAELQIKREKKTRCAQ